MAQKRNIVEEIELKKIRSNYPSKYGYSERFWSISRLTSELEKINSFAQEEALRYIPLAVIAATESYFRLLYQQIIDKGEPYFSNAVKYFKEQGNIKFDLEYLIALQGKQVTVGEIFSHLFQLNNLTDINQTLSKILGIDFLGSLKDFPHSQSMGMKPYSRKFKLLFGSYIESVNRLFEQRHIIAHEFALNLSIEKKKVLEDFDNLRVFLDACDFAVLKTIGDYVPEQQYKMNKYSQKKFKQSQSELNKLLLIIKKLNSLNDFNQVGDLRLFSKSFKEWEKYRELFSTSVANSFKGGSVYPTIYWSEMERQTNQMILNLKDTFSYLLKKNAS